MNKIIKLGESGKSIWGEIQLSEEEKTHWKKEETRLTYNTRRPGETVWRTESSSLQSELHLELSAWADGSGLGVLVICPRPVSGLPGPQLTHPRG